MFMFHREKKRPEEKQKKQDALALAIQNSRRFHEAESEKEREEMKLREKWKKQRAYMKKLQGMKKHREADHTEATTSSHDDELTTVRQVSSHKKWSVCWCTANDELRQDKGDKKADIGHFPKIVGEYRA